jgi:hypothetical protein
MDVVLSEVRVRIADAAIQSDFAGSYPTAASSLYKTRKQALAVFLCASLIRISWSDVARHT